MVQSGTWEWLLHGFKFELETQVKPRTVEYYYEHARFFTRWVVQSQGLYNPYFITKRHLQIFLHQIASSSETWVGGNGAICRAQRSERTRWHYYRTLKRFFTWATNEGYFKQNPLDSIKLKAPQPPPIEPYRPEHISQMIKVLDHDWQVAATPRQKMLAARDRAVLLLFLESGLRLGELSVLTVADVDLGKQRMLVRETKTGKGRITGFGPQTKKALWRYLGVRPAEVAGDMLWITEEGRPITPDGVREIIRRLKKDAGLDHVRGSVHKLRHTFATTYLRHTRDMKGCRLLLGHSTLTMTERYTQFIEVEDALKAYDGKGPLDWLRS